MLEENQLLSRAQKGDVSAFDDLMSTNEKQLFALCYRMAGDREDAMDCMQEAMIRIWRALKSYRKEASFSTWIYRITTNTCLDMLRKRKTRPSVSLDALTDAGFSVQDPSGDPEMHALTEAKRLALQAGIDALSPDMRIALILRDVQGFSYEEVASILNTPLGTVKSRINRAREKLRMIFFQNPELFGNPRVYENERRKDA